jgi:hypothetical protein
LLHAPPPQTIANEGRDGSSGSTQATLAAVSVAAASSVARLSTALPKKSLRSSDFGGGEIRVREKRAQNRAIGLASGSSRAVPVEGDAAPLQHQIVEQPFARSCVAGNWLLSRRDKT